MSGCSTYSDNPLSGKDTNERIIMCLEKAYPEHTFSVVESFDKKTDEGIFCDENGIAFSVHNILYDNKYHFGCYDDYLATILKEQSYFKILDRITSEHGYLLNIDEAGELVWIEQTNDSLNDKDFSQYAEMILEILNSVEIPQVNFPDEQGFSTGKVNYYSRPCLGILMCDISYKDTNTLVDLYFEDKTLSVEQLQQRFEDEYNELKISE